MSGIRLTPDVIINMKLAFKSALVSGLITGILAMAGYIIGLGDVFQIEAKPLINVFAMATLTTIVSLIKSSLTTETGKVMGVKIK